MLALKLTSLLCKSSKELPEDPSLVGARVMNPCAASITTGSDVFSKRRLTESLPIQAISLLVNPFALDYYY